jgi:hypothetical protein
MAAVRAVAGGTDLPVLVCSRFIEASDPARLDDPILKEALFAPLLRYPAAGNIVRLPNGFNEASMGYLDGIVENTLRGRDRFLFVNMGEGPPFETWLLGRLAPRHPLVQSLGNFGKVRVVSFQLQ